MARRAHKITATRTARTGHQTCPPGARMPPQAARIFQVLQRHRLGGLTHKHGRLDEAT